MPRRRDFLLKSGAALSVPLFGTVATADEQTDKIARTVFRLLRNGQRQQAKRLAETHGISLTRYDVRPTYSGDGDSSRIGTEDWFTNPGDNGTKVNFVVGSESDNFAWFQLWWDLAYDDTNLVDGASPGDAAIIAWEDSQWGLTDLDNVYYDSTAVAEDGSKQSVPIDMAGGGLVGERQNAIGLKIHDVNIGDESGIESMYGYLLLKLRKQNFPNRVPGRVETLYKHTWSPFDNAYFNFIENLTISKGPLSVKLDTFSDAWDFREDHSA